MLRFATSERRAAADCECFSSSRFWCTTSGPRDATIAFHKRVVALLRVDPIPDTIAPTKSAERTIVKNTTLKSWLLASRLDIKLTTNKDENLYVT